MTASTQTNAGYIGIGVTLVNATLTNTASGTITGPAVAVYGQAGSTDSVVNAGVLSGGSDATHSAGIVLFGGGLVSNAATGSISGGNVAIYIGQSSTLTNGGTVVNYGTIGGLGTHANGVEIDIGGLVTNAAGGTITGVNHGVLINRSANAQYALVVNAGFIAGKGGPSSTQAAGVYLQSGGTLVNNAGGTISGAATGVLVSGAIGTVINDGTIEATAVGSSGVALASGGTVVNLGSGSIDGALYGVESSNALTVANFGTIGGTADIGIGISGGFVTNAAGATISGTNTGIRIYTGGTVVDAGTITGGRYSAYFHAGFTNRLVLDPGAAVSGTAFGGNTVGATAVSTLELAPGALGGTLSGLGSSFVDFAQTTIDVGADWVLHGSNTLIAGATIANSGTLVVDGTLGIGGLVNDDPGLFVIGGTAGSAGLVTVGNGGTIALAAGTNAELVLGDAVASGTLAAARGTLDVTGPAAALLSDAPIAIGRSLGSNGLLIIQQGAIGLAQTLNEGTQSAVAIGQYGDGTLVVSGAGSTFTADGLMYVGRAGTGTLVVENQGTVVLGADLSGNGGDLQIGLGNSTAAAQTGGSGDALVTSGGVINSGSRVAIGGRGDTGTLTVNGGTVEATTLIALGLVSTIAGIAHGGSGVLNIGTGGLVETTGTPSSVNSIIIGQNQGASGTATVGDGGTLLTPGILLVGGSGAGTLTVDSGGTVASHGLSIGGNPSGTGTVIVNGGTLTETGGFFGVGNGGTGTLIVEAGGILSTAQVTGPAADIGASTGGHGSVTVTGTHSLWTVNGQFIVGDQGAGSLDINNGAVVNFGTSSLDIGNRTGGSGTVSVETGGTLTGNALFIAAPTDATGTLTVGDGGTVESAITLGANAVLANQAGGVILSDVNAVTAFGPVSPLVNAGSIGVTGSGSGIVLNTGGTVTNTASGVINGAYDGVQIAGTAGTVDNQGSIAGGQAGIALEAGGFVTNASTGVISGYYAILAANGAPATVVNAGEIVGTGSGILLVAGPGTVLNTNLILGTQAGIYLGAGGLVSNAAGGVIGGYYGVQSGASITVVNAGTIIGTGITTAGVQLNGGGTVYNAAGGTISGYWGVRGTGAAAATVVNGGTIIGGVDLLSGGGVTNQSGGAILYGIYLSGASLTNQAGGLVIGSYGVVGESGGASTVFNAGAILSGDVGIQLTDGGTVSNEASGQIIGYEGIAALNAAATVVNDGTVTGASAGPDSWGVRLLAGGVVVNSGSIYAGVEVDGGQVTNQALGTISGLIGVKALSVVNAGIIQGAGLVNTGVFLSGGAVTNLSTGTISGDDGIYDSTADVHPRPVTITNFGSVIGGSFGVALAGAGTVINAGYISGASYAVYFAASTSNLVVFDPGAIFAGEVQGGFTAGSTASSTLELASAAAAGTLTGLGSQFVGFSQIAVDAGATWVLDSTDTIAAGQTLTVNAGTLTDAAVLNNYGAIQLDPSSMTVGGLTGTGTTTIEEGSTLSVLGTIASTETIGFAGSGADLILGAASLAAGTIIGFAPGDTIDLGGIGGVTTVDLLPGDTLQIGLASGGPIDLYLTGDYSGDFFHHSASGGDTLITTDSVPCYLAGTRIQTSGGEIAVEKLRIGDRVTTLDGSLKPIKWIGRRSYAGAIPAGLRDVIPVLIQAGALADQVPQRDLVVSPLHAMYFDGVLVPAERLVNGVTIRRCPEIDPIRYFHIELDRHDVIYAEGAAAETFVDCDSRSMFHNAAEFDVLYAADPGQRWIYCAPRAEGGPTLDSIKRAIDARAGIEVRATDAQPGGLQGRLDGIAGGRVSGWAFSPDRPAEPVWLEIRDGDGVLGRVHANRYRADLEAAGIGDGRHGFELHLGGQLRGRRQIRAHRVQDGFELDGSPLLIDAPDGDALLEDARRVIAAAILDPSDSRALDRLADELLHGVDALRQLRAGPSASRKRQRRALFIDSVLPRTEQDAGSQAVLSHAAALTALGYQVEFVATHELARAEAASVVLEQAGYAVHRAPRIASVEEVLRRHRNGFEVVYMHRLANAEAYAPLVRTWQARARLVYSVADLHHVRLARQAAAQASEETAAAARAMRARELNAMRLCDTVITHSAAEAAYLGKTAPGAAVYVVPWTSLVRPRPMPFAARRDVVAIGSWSHEPNVDAVRWLVSDIMPRVWRQAPIDLLVVGSDWPSHVPWIADSRVRLVGAVPSMETLLATPRLSVAALRFGAGLKGKVLDSFAAEVPCVMTHIAAEGFPLNESLAGLVTDDPDAMASLIVRLHQDARFNRAAARDGLAMTGRFSAEAVRQAMASAVGSQMAGNAAVVTGAIAGFPGTR